MFVCCSKLKSVGQKVGAAGVLCHIRKSKTDDMFVLNVANVGDTEAVISRHGDAIPLSRLFVVNKDKEERQRIYKSDGIITEVNKSLRFNFLCFRIMNSEIDFVSFRFYWGRLFIVKSRAGLI